MTPSKYQTAIYETFNLTNSNICVIASAGSGKTHVLLQLLKQVPVHRSTIFLSFNKAIAEENRKKVPQHIDVSTIHSLGMKTLYKHYSHKMKVNEYKNFILSKKCIDVSKINKDKQNSYIMNISDIYNKAKFNLLTTREQIEEYLNKQFISASPKELDDVMKLSEVVEDYNESFHEEMMIDFTDMIYLPVKYKMKTQQFDNVMIDEGQDLNPLSQRFIEMLIKPRSGRFVMVGDEKQSIYAFLGSNSTSFQAFMNKPNTKVLPLSVSYRCSKKVVEEANKVIPGTEYYEGNVEGEVINDGKLEDIQEDDLVLCRNNSPLVELYIYFLSKNKKSIIYGKEFGKALQHLLSKLVEFESKVAIKMLKDELDRVAVELSDKGVARPEFHAKYVSLQEKIIIIELLLYRYKSPQDLYNHIEDIYSDDTRKCIILSTIHAQKGRQANNVFLYKKSLIPSKYCITQEDFKQEKNLMYVTITRAKNKFTYLKE